MVCQRCRKAFGLDSEVDVTVLQSVTDEVAGSSTISQAEDDDKIVYTGKLNDGNSTSTNAPSTDDSACAVTEAEEGRDSPECEVKPRAKKLKLSCSPAHSIEATPTCSTHCVACLGTLEEAFVVDIASSIPVTIQREGYVGFQDFCIAIHTSLSLMIRRMGMEKYLQKQNEDLKSECITFEGYVKEDLRTRLKEKLEKTLALPYKMDSPFQIIVKLDHSQSMDDCQRLVGMYPDCFRQQKRKKGHSRNKKPSEYDITIVPVRKALECATVEDFSQHGYLLSPVEMQCSYKIELLHKPLYIGGRYNKFSRSLPQTPWLVDGVRKADSSVQELISEELCRLTGSYDHTFLASGREDVDVRMLGTGRPFAVELSNPKKVCLSQEDINEAQKSINKKTDLIAVNKLTQVSKEETSRLKEGETDKKKEYCAVVWSKKEITAEELACLEGIKDLKLAQKTPIRVLHRRSLATRERLVHSMHCEVVDGHRFKLYLCSQAGTYIKEFVHSDFGRTRPSLGELLSGREVDILSLDVIDVQLEWPPIRL